VNDQETEWEQEEKKKSFVAFIFFSLSVLYSLFLFLSLFFSSAFIVFIPYVSFFLPPLSPYFGILFLTIFRISFLM
jgi:hypothetical protein